MKDSYNPSVARKFEEKPNSKLTSLLEKTGDLIVGGVVVSLLAGFIGMSYKAIKESNRENNRKYTVVANHQYGGNFDVCNNLEEGLECHNLDNDHSIRIRGTYRLLSK